MPRGKDMGRDEVLELADRHPARFASIKMILRNWRDEERLVHVLRHYATVNPDIREAMARLDQAPTAFDPFEEFSRIWYRHPNRVSSEAARSPNEFASEWSEPEVNLTALPPPTFTPILPPDWAGPVPPGPRPRLPDFDNLIYPQIGELLQPADVLATQTFREIAHDRYLDRGVLRIRGAVDWSHRYPYEYENLDPGDEYHALLDIDSGILLRFACLFDGAEFSVREMQYIEVEMRDMDSD